GSGEELVDLRGVELVDHAAAELHGRRQLVTGSPVLPQHGELLDLLDSGEGGVGPVDLVPDALLELRIVRRLGGRDDQRHDVRATIADDGDMRDRTPGRQDSHLDGGRGHVLAGRIDVQFLHEVEYSEYVDS